jgi:hypothetical protein
LDKVGNASVEVPHCPHIRKRASTVEHYKVKEAKIEIEDYDGYRPRFQSIFGYS